MLVPWALKSLILSTARTRDAAFRRSHVDPSPKGEASGKKWKSRETNPPLPALKTYLRAVPEKGVRPFSWDTLPPSPTGLQSPHLGSERPMRSFTTLELQLLL